MVVSILRKEHPGPYVKKQLKSQNIDVDSFAHYAFVDVGDFKRFLNGDTYLVDKSLVCISKALGVRESLLSNMRDEHLEYLEALDNER